MQPISECNLGMYVQLNKLCYIVRLSQLIRFRFDFIAYLNTHNKQAMPYILPNFKLFIVELK